MIDRRRILLLEDDPNLGLIIQESLESRGFAVTLCRDGRLGWTRSPSPRSTCAWST